MKEPTGSYAGVKDDLLSNHGQIIAQVKKNSESYYGFKAQEGRNIPFLRPKQVAEQLGVSLKALERWRKTGGGPPYTRLHNKTVRYSIKELDAWLKARTAIDALTDDAE